jgi:hypothetical protein
VYIELSEPVEFANRDKEKESFAYKLISARGEEIPFEVYTESKSQPRALVWSDSSVMITYGSFKTDDDQSFTPVPGDSVRLLASHGSNPLEHALKDLAGNFPNLNEWGRRLDGRGRSSVNKYLIAHYDPNDKDLKKLKGKMRERFGGNPLIDNLFPINKPIEFLLMPESCLKDVRECIEDFYPGTIGAIFWPGVQTNLPAGAKPEDIYFIANSFYHTNLGNYVVKSGELKIRCDDPIFKLNGQGDCRSNNGLYLAWDLKDNKGRMVGTGAYVQVYNFRWEHKGEALMKYPEEGNKVEMFGVRRAK